MSTGYGASEGYGTAQAQQSAEYTPLSAINPYTNSWVLKVRVTRKPEDLRTWEANAAGRKAGKAGTIDVRDGYGGEIQIQMFGAEADKFWNLFEKNKVYTISGGQIRTAKKQFSGGINNDYTIVLSRDSNVQYVEDDGSIGMISYKFTNIGRLGELDVQRGKDGARDKVQYCDIIGVAHEVKAVEDITSKAGATFTKRMIKIVDETGQVECTLWNDEAKKFGEDCTGRVIALNKCKVSSFNHRSLSARQDGVALDPKEARADELRQWYAEKKGEITAEWPPAMTVEGGGRGAGNYEPPMNLADSFSKGTVVKEDENGRFTGEWFQALAYPTVLSKKGAFYRACPQPNCWKKVVKNGNYWDCPTHGPQTSYQPRFITRFGVADHTGTAWMSVFHDQAMQMFNSGRQTNLTPADIEKYAEDGSEPDAKKYEELFKGPNFRPWLFNCLAKMERYDGQERRKVVCTRLMAPKWNVYSKHLIERINSA